MNLENLGVQEMSAQEVKNVDGGMNDRPFGQSDDFGADGSSAGSSNEGGSSAITWLLALMFLN